MKYVYDYKKADAFIKFGIRCIGTGCNKGNIYWVFDYDECQKYYEERNKLKNNNM